MIKENSNIIPKDMYKTFILAGKSEFIATCTITHNKVRFFVRCKRNDPNTYDIYILDDDWIHVAIYFSNNRMLHTFNTTRRIRNALSAVFKFENAPKWLTIEHCNRCPRCGRKISNPRYGFGEDCWKKTFEQLKLEALNESN